MVRSSNGTALLCASGCDYDVCQSCWDEREALYQCGAGKSGAGSLDNAALQAVEVSALAAAECEAVQLVVVVVLVLVVVVVVVVLLLVLVLLVLALVLTSESCCSGT